MDGGMRLFFIFIFGIGTLGAYPKNPFVREGEAHFQWGENLLVETADRTVIDWSDFSIEENETVYFSLPSSDAAVLNCVIEIEPSRLLGKLESNGCLIFVNPRGVLIGKKGEVDARAFFAMSLDRIDPLLWNWGIIGVKERVKGMVVNQGIIRSRDVCLVGYEVQNEGAIEAERAGLIGAREVRLNRDPFQIQTANFSSQIEGDLFAADKEDLPFSWSIPGIFPLNMPGPTVVEQGIIRSQSIVLLGDYIELKRRSILDASGDMGGSVSIGGGCGFPNWKGARIVRIDGTIKVDGRLAGQVLACSEGAMRFHGSISARGIENEGSIGLLGKISLECRGSIDSLYFDEHKIDNRSHD